MKHYVCPKCDGESEVPKVCETEGCEHINNPLKECVCEDSAHQEVQEPKE